MTSERNTHPSRVQSGDDYLSRTYTFICCRAVRAAQLQPEEVWSMRSGRRQCAQPQLPQVTQQLPANYHHHQQQQQRTQSETEQ